MSFEEWIAFGKEQGWTGPAVCATHDGTPTSEAEDDESWDLGEPPCQHIVRLYPDLETKAAVEANHAPSVWRK
jgi:hypothetical protein